VVVGKVANGTGVEKKVIYNPVKGLFFKFLFLSKTT
jgi:hypothetical protein